MIALTDDELLERVELVKKLGSVRAAARALGVNESNVRRALERATRRNIDGTWLGDPLPEGYLMGKVTRQYNGDGSIKNEWQRQLPTVEEVQRLCDELIEKMGDKITPLPPIDGPVDTVERWLTLYPVVDVHLGALAWGKETGADYDLHIAEEQFKASVSKLYNYSPNSSVALIEILGDFFHADDDDAQTHRSHNHLDVDGRHDKTMSIGIELILWHIDMALQKHQVVYVHANKGNHDERSISALLLALYYRYQNNPRVIIDRSPKNLWVFQWGLNMLAFTHGHLLKAEDMPGAMAAQFPEIWGQTKYRFGYSGHYHKFKKMLGGDERYGARWEILPAFTEKDAWNAAMGHSAQREIVSITFDTELGRQFSTFVTVS